MAERHYRAVKIGSRAQLLELAARGRAAEERVQQLLNSAVISPLVGQLGLVFHHFHDGWKPHALDHGLVHVRIAPYTRSPRFRGWATTVDAATAVRNVGEDLADCHGLAPGWVTPHPAGAFIEVPHQHPPHFDGFRRADAWARVVIDGEGVSGAALRIDPPQPSDALPRRFEPDELARELILPVVRGAAGVLAAGEFIGRSRCQIDLVGIQHAILLEAQGDRQPIADWVPTTTDLTLTATESELLGAARIAAYALARSAGLPFWDRAA